MHVFFCDKESKRTSSFFSYCCSCSGLQAAVPLMHCLQVCCTRMWRKDEVRLAVSVHHHHREEVRLFYPSIPSRLSSLIRNNLRYIDGNEVLIMYKLRVSVLQRGGERRDNRHKVYSLRNSNEAGHTHQQHKLFHNTYIYLSPDLNQSLWEASY